MFKYFCLAFLLSFGSVLIAQNNINNIFSYHHLGLFEHNENAYQMAIGGTKYGLIDSVMSNTSNPATLAFLFKGQPVFNIEISGRQSFFETNSETSNSRVAYMRGLNFSIPFANRFGIGFGYRPTFSKGYRFNEYQVVEGDSLNRIYLGSGGVQQAFFSFAVAPVKNEKTLLSFGVEGNFNFGSPTNIRAIEFVTPSASNAANIYSDTVRGFGFMASLAFKHEVSKTFGISLGGSYRIANDWRTRYTDRLVGYGGNYGVNSQVTQVINNAQWSGNISTPSVLGVGLGLDFKPQGFNLNAKKESLLRLNADYETISWENYSRTLQGTGPDTTFNYQNTTSYRIGLEFTPHYKAIDRSPGMGYFNIVSYRIGFNLNQIALPNENLSDRGMTFGFGFPVNTGPKSISHINVGIRAGQVGSTGLNPMQENYISYQIGIMLRPTSLTDRWFNKYKYN